MDALKSLREINSPKKETTNEFLHRLSTPKSSVRGESFSPDYASRSKSGIQRSLVVEGRKVRPCSVAAIDSKLRYAEKIFERIQVVPRCEIDFQQNAINSSNALQGYHRLKRIDLMKKIGIIEPEVVDDLGHHIKKEYGISIEDSKSDSDSLDNNDCVSGAPGKNYNT